MKNHPLLTKLTINPRDALSGGRTENIVLNYSVKNGEKIKYYDVTSLYPFICKTSSFPLGHPRIYIGSQCDELTSGNNQNLNNVQGLIKCKILPPQNLFLPLLGQKYNGRLIFGLCNTCCIETRQTDCTHPPNKRIMTGTWVADEVKKAVELGYKIIEILIIWQYEMCQYNNDTKTGGLFAGYIDKFLKLKQQASGYPQGCVTEEAKDLYIENYYEKEGILLDKNSIEKNPGLRSLAKYFLNSLWGKLCQKPNLKRTEIVKTREHLLKILCDSEKEVSNILIVSDSTLYVEWAYIEAAVPTSSNTNVVIGS